MAANAARPFAEKNALQHKPFGLTHPTWNSPTCFLYASEAEARAAIIRAYGEGSGHLIVRVLPPAEGNHDVYRCECVTDDHEKPHTRILPPAQTPMSDAEKDALAATIRDALTWHQWQCDGPMGHREAVADAIAALLVKGARMSPYESETDAE